MTRLAAVAVAAVLGLAGCSAHPGVAAVVGDRTITEDDLARTQREIGPLVNNAPAGQILGAIIVSPLYVEAAADRGVGVSEDDAVQLLTQLATTSKLDVPEEWGSGALAIAEQAIAQTNLQKLDDGETVLADLKTKVTTIEAEVNPRYGTWKDGTIAAADLPWLTAPDTATAP